MIIFSFSFHHLALDPNLVGIERKSIFFLLDSFCKEQKKKENDTLTSPIPFSVL